MNDRIKELLKQSGLQPYYEAQEGQIEKFAELIVRECTNMLPEDSVRNEDGVHMFYVIRDHFGVRVIGR